MKCPKCGSENRGSVRFCENCGSLLDKAVKKKTGLKKEIFSKQVCPKCGANNRLNILFCEECGASLKQFSKKNKKNLVSVIRGSFHENPFRPAFYFLLIVCVVLSGFLVFNRMINRLSAGDAKRIAEATITSNYPELQGIQPVIDDTNEDGQKISTFTYSKNMSGQTDDGVDVEFTISVVVQVNRSNGEFRVLENY